MTTPTQDRVRELAAAYRERAQQIHRTPDSRAECADTAAILADWLRLGEKPAPSRAYTGCGGTFIKRDENGNRKLIGEPCEGCPDCSPTPSAQAKCPDCSGPASPNTHNLHMCNTCNGKGYLGQPLVDLKTCAACNGTGAAPPSAQAKCEQRTLTGDERDAMRRAYQKSVTPVASAQAREALETTIVGLRDVLERDNEFDCLDMHETTAVKDAITLLRSLSANVGGGGGATSAVDSQWRDIATAPRDVAILGWFPYYTTNKDGGSVFVMHWCNDQFAKKPRPYFEASGWVWGVRDQREKQPTHWQPLPAAPVSA